MGLTIQIREDDLDDATIEAAIAADEEPMSLFRQRLKAVADRSTEVEDRDREAAIVYAISEVLRTANHADNSGNVANDSSALRGDKFDLRDRTKLD